MNEMTGSQAAPKITAVICTYNRAKYLGRAIESLLRQSVPEADYELIVVDNASTDGTAEVVKKYGERLMYVFEPSQGLSFAKNTAFRNSTAGIVAYLDDDAVACDDWIKEILSAFEMDSSIAAVGGIIEPEWEIQKPWWLIKELYPYFSCQNKGPEPFFLERGYFYGGNSAFRNQVLEDSGGFPEKLGRIGKAQIAHEEWPVYNFIDTKGLKKYYVPAMLITHTVLKERLRIGALMHKLFWLGVSEVYHDRYYDRLSRGEATMKHLKGVVHYYMFFFRQHPVMLALSLVKYAGVYYAVLRYGSMP